MQLILWLIKIKSISFKHNIFVLYYLYNILENNVIVKKCTKVILIKIKLHTLRK